MRQKAGYFVLALGSITLAAMPAFGGDDDTISISEVPENVRKAAEKELPHASWTKAFSMNRKGHAIYQLKGKDERGHAVEAEVTRAGRVIEVETTVPFSEVPRAVAQKLKSEMPSWEPKEAETITKNGQVVSYGFEGKAKDGKKAEIYIAADGSKVLAENEDDDKGQD